jgi:pantoate--beta-alanine ligase
MKIVRSVSQWRTLKLSDVGFVPTMGALHEGHLGLVRMAKERRENAVVSIFVNPTQFNDPEDLRHYPRPLEKDLALLEAEGVAAVFLPSAEELYADSYRFTVSESRDSMVLCGAHRPGHFTGVLTIVLKLFNVIQPRQAFFGEKDYQQLRLISDMVNALLLPVEIVPGPTCRESDGLAMSSRNLLLSPEERERAPRLYQILSRARSAVQARIELENEGFKVDYVEDMWGRRLAATRLGQVRLIDNVAL